MEKNDTWFAVWGPSSVSSLFHLPAEWPQVPTRISPLRPAQLEKPSLQIWCIPSTPDDVEFTFPLYAKAKGNNPNSLSLKSQEIYYFQPDRSLLGEEHHTCPWRWKHSPQCPRQPVRGSSITITHTHLCGSHRGWSSIPTFGVEPRKRIQKCVFWEKGIFRSIDSSISPTLDTYSLVSPKGMEYNCCSTYIQSERAGQVGCSLDHRKSESLGLATALCNAVWR